MDYLPEEMLIEVRNVRRVRGYAGARAADR